MQGCSERASIDCQNTFGNIILVFADSSFIKKKKLLNVDKNSIFQIIECCSIQVFWILIRSLCLGFPFRAFLELKGFSVFFFSFPGVVQEKTAKPLVV